jgi:hypothetical protein
MVTIGCVTTAHTPIEANAVDAFRLLVHHGVQGRVRRMVLNGDSLAKPCPTAPARTLGCGVVLLKYELI